VLLPVSLCETFLFADVITEENVNTFDLVIFLTPQKIHRLTLFPYTTLFRSCMSKKCLPACKTQWPLTLCSTLFLWAPLSAKTLLKQALSFALFPKLCIRTQS